MERFEHLEKALCKELEVIEQKLKGGAEMSAQELDKVDKIVHAMKSLVTYEAMKEADEYSENMSGGMSGYRGRAMNGRYVSRDMDQSYADGYSRGYEEGRSQAEMQRSGRYFPPSYPKY